MWFKRSTRSPVTIKVSGDLLRFVLDFRNRTFFDSWVIIVFRWCRLQYLDTWSKFKILFCVLFFPQWVSEWMLTLYRQDQEAKYEMKLSFERLVSILESSYRSSSCFELYFFRIIVIFLNVIVVLESNRLNHFILDTKFILITLFDPWMEFVSYLE